MEDGYVEGEGGAVEGTVLAEVVEGLGDVGGETALGADVAVGGAGFGAGAEVGGGEGEEGEDRGEGVEGGFPEGDVGGVLSCLESFALEEGEFVLLVEGGEGEVAVGETEVFDYGYDGHAVYVDVVVADD